MVSRFGQWPFHRCKRWHRARPRALHGLRLRPRRVLSANDPAAKTARAPDSFDRAIVFQELMASAEGPPQVRGLFHLHAPPLDARGIFCGRKKVLPPHAARAPTKCTKLRDQLPKS